MRIGFDVSYIQTNRAGAGRYALELLQMLLAANSDDDFVLHGWSFSLDRPLLSSLAGERSTMRMSRLPGNVKRFYWDHCRWLPLRWMTGPLDIFHSCDAFLPPLGRTKGVSTVHDICQKRFPQYFQRGIHRRDRHLQRALEGADAIVVPSQQTRTDLLDMFSIPSWKIHLVYPPIHQRFHPPDSPAAGGDAQLKEMLHVDRPFVLFVGTLEPRKNVVSLISAFEHADRILSGALSLVIVGKPGWMFHDIFRAIENSPVRQKIRYLRYVSDEDLAILYRRAHMFVYPSYYEGFGYPVFEAMASGIPVVTSNSSSLKELALGAAELTDPSDQDDLVRAIVCVARDEHRRRELIDAGLQRVRWLSSQDPVTRVNHVYRQLVTH